MKGIVVKPYQQPYDDPIAAATDDPVMPDFHKVTDIKGWVWCTARDGRSGWTPRNWLAESNGEWHLTRDFNALELTVAPGERLEIEIEESGFYLVKMENGRTGWIPCECVQIDGRT